MSNEGVCRTAPATPGLLKNPDICVQSMNMNMNMNTLYHVTSCLFISKNNLFWGILGKYRRRWIYGKATPEPLAVQLQNTRFLFLIILLIHLLFINR